MHSARLSFLLVPVWLLATVGGCSCDDEAPLIPRPTVARPAPEPDPLPDATVVIDCFDPDGDGFGQGPDCAGPDCDQTDPRLGANGSRPCYTGPADTASIGSCRVGTQRCVEGFLSPCEGEIVPSPEVCDNLDNDCDRVVDEDIERACYGGPAGTAGLGTCRAGVQRCQAGRFGTCAGEVVPRAEECDGFDTDCDGEIDEDLARSCFRGPPETEGIGVCRAGIQTCGVGGWGECVGEQLPQVERCDGVDNDCDGVVDEGVERACYTGPEGSLATGVCAAGIQHCLGGAYAACVNQTLPSAETCDGRDNDCDGKVDEEVGRSCYTGPAQTLGVGLCVAGVQSCFAGSFGACLDQVLPAEEICDGLDNDCDGEIDEGLSRACYTGPAGTGGVGACHAGTQICAAGAWGACQGERLPAVEVCDAEDNDCDGAVDEGIARTCFSGPAGALDVGVCRAGTQACAGGTWEACQGEVLPSAEFCDGQDNDCDGAVDEELVRACYGGPAGTEGQGLCRGGTQVCVAGSFGECVGEVQPSSEQCDGVDNDCDGETDEHISRSCYTGPPGSVGTGACVQGTQVCEGGAFGECRGQIEPSPEACDGQDNDCDGQIDEGLTRACYAGPAGTAGVGQCRGGTASCHAGEWVACQGEVLPGLEICDGLDNDCDGEVDEQLSLACYEGPGGTRDSGLCRGGSRQCVGGAWGACDGQVLPAAETCDGLDNDCDGQADEELVRACYTGPGGTQDRGVCLAGIQTCVAGTYAACVGEVLPGVETCDGLDNDCDGQTDEALTRRCYTGPAATDGIGTCSPGLSTCVAGQFTGCEGEVLPGQEVCDNLDNDCDGRIDQDLSIACYAGPPGTEGTGVCRTGISTCVAGSFGVCEGQVLPSAELCDALDNDCDGEVDEALTRVCYSGPAGTADIGQCRGGTATCAAGRWGACDGEVLPVAETCDGLDNDCDGQSDEVLTRACYAGPEGTAGVGVCARGVQACSAGAFGECVGEVQPSSEVCDNLDNDCDGIIDQDLSIACYSGPPGTEEAGVCRTGTSTCVAGSFGACEGQVLPSAELCDALDNNCDGQIDEALTRACYSGPAGTADVGQCRGGTATCAAGSWGGCDGEVLPVAEVCDGRDNDCDGQIDGRLELACYSGPAGTANTGTCRPGIQSCSDGQYGVCEGEVLPGAERCDGVDNDCDGHFDENVTRYTQDGSDQHVEPVFRPVDIILVIDNSGSMTDEIRAVEDNINVNFASIMDQSGLDYRVILISRHGSARKDQSICIGPPLGGNTRCNSACPTNGARFFHYSVEIGSYDSLSRILSTYNQTDACSSAPGGWSTWLRPGAARIFIEITDDGPRTGNPSLANSMTADSFEAGLFTLNPPAFGSAAQRDYIFHTIAGLKENAPALSPWAPSAPLVQGLCTGAGGQVMQNGLEYQKLSQRTLGLRYPICQHQSFDAVFQEVALGIVAGSEMSCMFQVSSVPDDSGMDNTLLDLVPSNGGGRIPMQHVANEAACAGHSFYTEGPVIKLCPEACTLWRDDPGAQVEVLFTCEDKVR